MNNIAFYLALLLVSLVSCTGEKTTDTTADTSSTAVVKKTLPDSIDAEIATFDVRLDIKMKRKTYEPKPGSLTTVQKWFEYGDTTRLVKLREEILTGDTKMEVIQYHFLNHKLAEIHDYLYNKKCDGGTQQCMEESKYFFKNGTFDSAVQRKAVGTAEAVPVIENVTFQAIQPQKSLLNAQVAKLDQINKKYSSLPYPKPRPENGNR